MSKQIAVLVETDDTWGRTVVGELIRLASDRGWRLLIAPRDEQHRLRLPRHWKGDGVVASIRDSAMRQHLWRLKLPTVDLSAMIPKEDWFARVITDDRKRAEMALEYLRCRGFAQFAIYAPRIGRYGPGRGEVFRNLVLRCGYSCETFVNTKSATGWSIDHQRVRRWLEGLPHPTAVFAADPYPARQLAEVCSSADIPVPDQIAILAGDDDDLLCETANPQLSAVQLDGVQLARQAVDRLQFHWRLSRASKRCLRIPPRQVITRRSTDYHSVSMPSLQTVLRFIDDHAHTDIRVTDLLKVGGMSRRNLELLCRRELSASPAELIRRARMVHARSRILDGRESLTQIALNAGFASSAAFSQQYKAYFGMCPSVHR